MLGFTDKPHREPRKCFKPLRIPIRSVVSDNCDRHSEFTAFQDFRIDLVEMPGFHGSIADICARRDLVSNKVRCVIPMNIAKTKEIFDGTPAKFYRSMVSNIYRRRLPDVAKHNVTFKSNSITYDRQFVRRNGNIYPWPKSYEAYSLSFCQTLHTGVSSALCFVSASFRMAGSFTSIPRGKASSSQRKPSYKGAHKSEPECPFGPDCRSPRGIRGLPLSAKIGLTGVLTCLASCICLWPFIRLLNGRGNILQCFSAGVVGIGLVAISGLLFW